MGQEDPETEISMLEELIGELLPLETPAEALSRWARGGVKGAKESALKTRSRLRQMLGEAGAVRKETAAPGRPLEQGGAEGERKSKRTKLNEWGYEEPAAVNGDATPAANSATDAAPAADVEMKD